MGSGIAQLILVLMSAAINKPEYILIDEPELNLHPSLQLDFLTSLASCAKQGVLFATHSYGLARAAADRIYSVSLKTPGESQVRPYEETPQLSEFLGAMSYSGYADLGFQKVLLVEGPTDLRVVQQFLRLYKKDHKVVLIHLGGASSINGHSDAELLEIKRICTDVSALVDSERTESSAPPRKDVQAFSEACKRVGIKCHVTEHRAMENYFTDSAVKKAKGEKYRALNPFERLKDADPCWAKSENWRIAREMSLADVDATDIGIFFGNI